MTAGSAVRRRAHVLLRRALSTVMVTFFVTAAAVVYVAIGGIATNKSPSMPNGTYLGLPFFPIVRNGIVVACLPPDAATYAQARGFMGRGNCNGQEGVVKIVAAVAGDRVDVEPSYVAINGVRLTNSGRITRDHEGRLVPAVPTGERVVPPGNVWLMAPNPESWDSRYYGLVTKSLIRMRYLYWGSQPHLRFVTTAVSNSP